jgi:hypothetical protein
MVLSSIVPPSCTILVALSVCMLMACLVCTIVELSVIDCLLYDSYEDEPTMRH